MSAGCIRRLRAVACHLGKRSPSRPRLRSGPRNAAVENKRGAIIDNEVQYSLGETVTVTERGDGQVVVLNSATGLVYAAEGTGAQLLSLVSSATADGVNLRDIVERFSREYSVDTNTVTADVTEYFEALESAKIVRRI
ncbi:PqqD family protein [Microbacterium arabinogalactanolyticum]|uniref:PqqD family protein n=1 Tax=Microbacterium arabinogalactanolyticum TaxID=69365 RepID=UPI00404442ED